MSASPQAGNVTTLASKVQNLESEIEGLENQISAKKKEIETILKERLPLEMDSAGVRELVLANGDKLKIGIVFTASMPTQEAMNKGDDDKKAEMKQRYDEGMEWLRNNNAESLIKNYMTLEFSKGQDNMVGPFIELAEKLDLPYLRETSVHNATLKKFLEERVKDGKEVPEKTFSVFKCRMAKITKSKSKSSGDDLTKPKEKRNG